MRKKSNGLSLFKFFCLAFVAIFGVMTIVGSSDDDDDKSGSSTTKVDKASVSGIVTGSGGLVGVKVSADGVDAVAITDEYGFYLLEDIPISNTGRIVLTFEKSGYASYQKSVPAKNGENCSVSSVSLLRYAVAASVNAATDETVGNLKTDDVSFELPANSLIDKNGNAIISDVTISIVVGNPAMHADRDAFPGEYMATNPDGNDVILESVVFTEITVNSNGIEITEIADDKPATVTLRLPESLQSVYTAGDTIPWWSYDKEKEEWIREDADPSTTEIIDDAKVIEVDGYLCVEAEITHLSWWNADYLFDIACLCVDVVDGEDKPLQGVEVVANGVSYNSLSRSFTNAEGKACVDVKPSIDGETPETVKIKAMSGSVEFIYNVTSADEGNVDDDLINTPISIDECQELKNKIVVSFEGEIRGTVTRDITDNPVVPDFTIYTSFGATATTDQEGKYELNVPLNTEIILYAPGFPSKKVTVTTPGTNSLTDSPLTVDFKLPNRAPVIDSLTLDPSGTVEPEDQVTLTAKAHDDDGDSITYVWSATTGELSSDAGAQTFWTAPNSPETGSATITLTVTDVYSKTATTQRSITWGTSAQTTGLKITIQYNPEDKNPVEDVYVVLYNDDNKTIREFKQTDAYGVADFGDIGKNRATVTIAYENTENGYTHRDIETFVDAPVGDFVYYVGVGDDDYNCSNSTMINASMNWGDNVVPENVDYCNLSPFYSSSSNNNLTFNDVNICPYDIQSDEKISMLAQAYEYDENYDMPKLVKYGFLLDQELAENGTYEIDMDKNPVDIMWNSTTPIGYLSIFGERQGISYNLCNQFSEQGLNIGTLPFPDKFPASSYWMTAGSGYYDEESSNTFLFMSKSYSSIPNSIDISMPDFSFDSVDFDSGTDTFTWTCSGSMERDWMELNIDIDDYLNSVYTNWTVMMNGSSLSWTVVDIPEAIQGWIPDNVDYAIINATDFDTVTGFDQVFYSFVQGVDIESETNEMFRAFRSFSMGASEETDSYSGLTMSFNESSVSKIEERQVEGQIEEKQEQQPIPNY